MSPLHVLVVPSWYHSADQPYSGMFFRDWAWALRTAGVEVGIAYVENRSLRRLSLGRLSANHFQTTVAEEDGLTTVRLRGWNTLAQYTPGGLILARLAHRVICAYVRACGRPDLIAAQSVLWAGLGARHASRSLGVPYSITEVNTNFGTGSVRGWQASISRRAFADASCVVAISANLRERLLALGGAGQVDLVPCAVDHTYWVPPPTPRGTTPFTFYAQALLTPRKGFDILIRAFACRFRGDTSVRLVIGGDGAIFSSLAALVSRLGIHSQVRFLGALPRDGVRQAMWNANCLVLPSLAENFGVVLIEALCTGLPVISTRCGGPEDIITPDVGVLLPPGDERALADALVTVRNGRGYDGDALRAYATRRFGYATVGAQLRDLYCKVSGKRGTSVPTV